LTTQVKIEKQCANPQCATYHIPILTYYTHCISCDKELVSTDFLSQFLRGFQANI